MFCLYALLFCTTLSLHSFFSLSLSALSIRYISIFFFHFQPLPQVPRLWLPAAQCPECAYPNDYSFVFCQRCGYHRKCVDQRIETQKVSIDLPEIDERISSLRQTAESKPYAKQKSSLLMELESFLYSLPSPKNPLGATPDDLVRFLVWKDKKGKTKVHTPSCDLFGSKSKTQCPCPTRLSAGTVDTLIGKLRSLFTDMGRGGEWNELLGVGNPAAHKRVKQYLLEVREEQASARVTPKQAIPIFLDKLSRLCSYLREKTFSPSLPAIQRFLFARDLSFFSLDFFAGDRASDLGRIFTKEILSSSDKNTLLFRHTFGKTLRGKDTNVFMIKRCNSPSVCPVNNLYIYIQLCDLMGINLRDGYLFRVSDKKGQVLDSPFLGSASANRLSLHLRSLNIHQGETMHSFRGGCSITLSLLGVSPQDISRHVGWKSLVTTEYYSQCDKVMDPGRAATALARAASSDSNDCASSLTSPTTDLFTAKNELQGWELAFPRQ